MFHDILICDDIDVDRTTCIVKYRIFCFVGPEIIQCLRYGEDIKFTDKIYICGYEF